MKKQTVVALVLVLSMPLLLILGGRLSALIDPEIAARHANYARSFHLLMLLKGVIFFGSLAVVLILWLVGCFLVIRSKERSPFWLFFALLGPIGFALLTLLNDKAPAETDLYARFLRRMNWFMRVGYEVCLFVAMWLVAYQAMIVKRNLMILYQSATTGMSTAQIIAEQSASSGMWAFSEGLEVMFLVVLFYLLWPIAFNIVGRVATTITAPKAR